VPVHRREVFDAIRRNEAAAAGNKEAAASEPTKTDPAKTAGNE